ncbi:hypothetical protein AN958_01955 [Leucoagaricus sp. SymC.cos]|nr:hypothetical protein AN958_01955 [Leucoagaricus sp. SymC.cos]
MDIIRDWVAKTVKVDIPEPRAPMSKSYLKIVSLNARIAGDGDTLQLNADLKDGAV